MLPTIPLITSVASSLLGPATAVKTAPVPTNPAESFSAMMASYANNTVDTLKTSESMSIAGIQGKATTQSVVEAVMSAQESLQTALAVRDKAVAAFQDISRMPI